MRLEHLVDTDWVIHYLNGQSHIVARLDGLKAAGLALSVISLAELYEGVYASTDPEGNERALRDFLGGVAVLGVDTGICQRFGRERARLRRAGRLTGPFSASFISGGQPTKAQVLDGSRNSKQQWGLRVGGKGGEISRQTPMS